MSTTIETQRRAEAFRFKLRQDTRSEHRSLDAHPALADLVAGRLSLAGYARLMGLFHELYQGLDGALSDACDRLLPDGCGYAYAERARLIAGDLASLGASTATAAAPAGSYPTLGSLCGALYVVEGSLLGGAVLQRATEALLAPGGGDGDAYWRWCRDAGGKRWGQTCALIEDAAATPAAQAEMVESARATFGRFSDWLGRWPTVGARTGPAPC